MADRLEIYRGACRLLGQQRIVSLTDTGTTRRSFDDAWQATGDYLLAKGLWNFALRTVELSSDEDVEPRFGFEYGFQKPEDWVRTADLCDDPTMESPTRAYEDEPDYWFADTDPLYVRYVSNDVEYGWDVARWRQPFAKAFEAYLAFESGLPVTNDKQNRNDLFQLFEKRLAEAKTLDAVDERVRMTPAGRLVASRQTRATRY